MKTPGWAIALFLLVAPACAPQPHPPPAPVASPARPAPPAPSIPTPNPEEAAWAKIVEAAKQEGKLTIYTFSFTGALGEPVRREFEKAYGIKVEIVGGTGAILMERIKSEQGANKYIADTYDTAPGFVLTAKAQGLLQAVGDLPALRQRASWRITPHDAEKYMYPVWTTVAVPFYNSQLVKAGETPRSFKELLDPRWKGKIALAPPAVDPMPIYVYLAGKKAGFVDDEYFRRLGRHDLKVVPTVRDTSAAVARGEAALLLLTSMSIANPFILEGAPLRPIEPEEGAIVTWGSTIGIVNRAPHPNAARLFINWLLTPHGQEVVTRVRGITPARTDVADFTPEVAKISLKKAWPLELADLEEISRLQRGMVVDKLMGLEK